MKCDNPQKKGATYLWEILYIPGSLPKLFPQPEGNLSSYHFAEKTF